MTRTVVKYSKIKLKKTMKKILLTIVAAFTLMSAWAIEDAEVTITMRSTNSRYSVVTLEQGAMYTNEKNATDIIANIGNTTTAINIYAMADYGKMSIMTTNDLVGVYLGFTTNSCTDDYTLTFTGVSGMQLYLVDHVENHIEPIIENGVYEFDASALSTIENRFQIAHSISVTTNAYGWASFSSNINLVAPAGLTVYEGSLAGDVLNLNAKDYIKANEGVILYGDANQTYQLTPGNGVDAYNNDLKPSSAWASHSGTIFVLHDEALYQYTGSDMPANKAYLQISSGPNPAPKHIRMVIAGTNAVDNVEVETVKAEKFVEGGQIFIRRGNEVFNLQGQIVK